MRRTLVAALALLATPTFAQEPFDQEKFIGETFTAAYALWGMMAAAETTCTQATANDPAYAAAAASWRAESEDERTRIDAAFAGSDQPQAIQADGEKAGTELMASFFGGEPDTVTACRNWLTRVTTGGFEAREMLSYQFAILMDEGLMEASP